MESQSGVVMEMDQLVALCKRRGFLFQSSEIYGGLQGFWDYGPLGVELKRNVREAWWRDMVSSHNELEVSPGAPAAYEMVGLDCSIIMHPQVWKCSGHYDLFQDLLVDCRESQRRYRYDQIVGRWVTCKGQRLFMASDLGGQEGLELTEHKAMKFFNLRGKDADALPWEGPLVPLGTAGDLAQVVGPDAKTPGTLTEPREFNLMFETHTGAVQRREQQGLLCGPKPPRASLSTSRTCWTARGCGFPSASPRWARAFATRSRPATSPSARGSSSRWRSSFSAIPATSPEWYRYWRDRRYRWYLNLGLAGERLRLRDHEKEELSHYSCGTADIEYAFPFLPPGEFGELEGVAHRGDFDLRSHIEGKLVRQGDELVVELDAEGKPRHRGSGKDLSYFDDQTKERYIPHVIEPSAGADQGHAGLPLRGLPRGRSPRRKRQAHEACVP